MSYKYTYDDDFFDFVSASSGRSAALFLERFVATVLREGLPPSVLDIGCGRGAWLADWIRRGVPDAVGVDGAYVDVDSLAIPPSSFRVADLSGPLDLGRRFALVQCLEVAEHVHEAHADVVLFSAAIPGQGGEFHVNEQPYEYWRTKFATRGYEVFDAVRPVVAGLDQVEPWYRYNAFVFANAVGCGRLTSAAQATRVAPGARITDRSPLWWRWRCAAIARLPAPVSLRLARLKHRIANLAHRGSA